MTDKEKLRYVQIGLYIHNIEVHTDILKKLIPITELILKKKGKTDLEDIYIIKPLKI